MKSSNKQTGMAVVELVLILLGLVLIGFVGYKVYDARQSADRQLNQSTSGSSSKASSATDLNTTESTLDQVNPDEGGSDLNELDSQLSNF